MNEFLILYADVIHYSSCFLLEGKYTLNNIANLFCLVYTGKLWKIINRILKHGWYKSAGKIKG